jgi:hypothetical protein
MVYFGWLTVAAQAFYQRSVRVVVLVVLVADLVLGLS